MSPDQPVCNGYCADMPPWTLTEHDPRCSEYRPNPKERTDEQNPTTSTSAPPRSFVSRVEEADASGRLPGCPCGLTGPVKAPLVITVKPECPHHGTGTAWAAGYAGAVTRLRRDSEYRRWWSLLRPTDPDFDYWGVRARGHLADYLESTGPDGLPVKLELAAKETDHVEHRCPSCGSTSWVSVSLDEGYTRRAQCVPCGKVHARLGPGWRA